MTQQEEYRMNDVVNSLNQSINFVNIHNNEIYQLKQEIELYKTELQNMKNIQNEMRNSITELNKQMQQLQFQMEHNNQNYNQNDQQNENQNVQLKQNQWNKQMNGMRNDIGQIKMRQEEEMLRAADKSIKLNEQGKKIKNLNEKQKETSAAVNQLASQYNNLHLEFVEILNVNNQRHGDLMKSNINGIKSDLVDIQYRVEQVEIQQIFVNERANMKSQIIRDHNNYIKQVFT